LDNQIKASSAPITVSVTGIPTNSIPEVKYSQIKGAPIRIFRSLHDASTGELLTSVSPNPVGRFSGFINNFTIIEEYDYASRTAFCTIDFYCSSNIEFLNNVVKGRKTNPDSYRALYPNDPSMDRVPNLVNNVFDFGAPK